MTTTDPDAGNDTTNTDDGSTDKDAEIEKWKSLSRKHEANAKANADAATKLAALEASSKSDADKVAERIAKLEADNAAARAEALRMRIAAKHKISDEDAELFLTGSDEETLDKQAKRLAEQAGDRKKAGNVVRDEGKNTNQTSGSDDLRAITRTIFGRD